MDNLRSNLVRFMSEYADELSEAKRTENFRRPLGTLVRNDIPNLIGEEISQAKYVIKGSVGTGRWTTVPWIAVFDKRITTSAQEGVYIVYLLNKDTKTLYLTLNQGAKKQEISALKEFAKETRKKVGEKNLDYEGIVSGSEEYDAGCIYYKKYTLEDIPGDRDLFKDLNEFTDLYEQYYEKCHIPMSKKTTASDEEWFPSLDEYNPGIDKDQWLELLKDGSTFTENAYIAIAALYDHDGNASCKQLEKKYGNKSGFYRSSLGTQLASKVRLKLNIPYWKDGDERRVWPILFQGRNAKDEPGNYVWKIRPELYQALTEFEIKRYLKRGNDDLDDKVKSIAVKDSIIHIKSYIASKGFSYNDGLVENFYLSLKSKPFVILAGTSGTGKTRLVKLFSEAIGAEYEMVSVRPDWSDGSDMFGHYDLNRNFVAGPICSAFEAAITNPAKPVILCLDEMNLARVEYYLSDFLSVIESREWTASGSIKTDAIAQYKDGIPDNLYVVGTVNMDETTFPFSKKVLDRANTIEFNYVDLTPSFDDTSSTLEPLQLTNDFLATEYLVLAHDCSNEKEYVIQITDELQRINQILQKANAHVGYRVRDEIAFYMVNNRKAGELITYEQALDNEIMQKILPRIQGSSTAIKEMLVELFKYCMGDYSGLDIDSGSTGKRMQALADSARFPESAKKIGYMMTRYEEDGFTSYWL